MAFKPLGNLLTQQIKRAGIAQNVQSAMVIEIANRYIDEKWGEGTSQSEARAIAVKHGKLQIASMHSTFRQEIHIHSDEIKSYINTKCQCEFVKEVQTVI